MRMKQLNTNYTRQTGTEFQSYQWVLIIYKESGNGLTYLTQNIIVVSVTLTRCHYVCKIYFHDNLQVILSIIDNKNYFLATFYLVV